ncbi:MAG: hypothetical protein U0T73_08830 [Chitinophagales bacterium]
MGKQRTVLSIVVLLAVFYSSCKKEMVATTDPNIVYRSINKTIDIPAGGANVDSIDLNNDGKYDLVFMLLNQGADTGGVQMGGLHDGFEMATAVALPFSYILLHNASQLSAIGTPNYSSATYITYKSDGVRLGLISGEGYLVFRFTTGTKFQYGWMKVGLNTSCTQFRIIEYAYQLLPETAIAVGAK